MIHAFLLGRKKYSRKLKKPVRTKPKHSRRLSSYIYIDSKESEIKINYSSETENFKINWLVCR
jgi:hypothetical protein